MKNQDTNQSVQEAKKQYLSPELVEVGNFTQLTLAGSTNAADGGVSGP